jgi:hypothetical protein
MKRTIEFNEGDVRLSLIESSLFNDDSSVTTHSPIHEILTLWKVCRKSELSEVFALPGCYAASICGSRRFGTIYRSIFDGQTVHWPWRWNRYLATKRRKLTTNLRCVTSWKSEDQFYTAAEAWNEGIKCSCGHLYMYVRVQLKSKLKRAVT